MRIVQAPLNIAGQPLVISRAQRELGYKSDVIIFNNDFSARDCDKNLRLNEEKSWFKRTSRILGNFVFCLKNYDIFHFHYGKSLLPYNLDLPILRLLGKKTIMQYWGTDVIQFDIAVKRTEYSPEEIQEVFHEQDDNEKRQKIAKMEKKVDVSVIGDYALLIYTPKSKIIPIALDLKKIDFVGVEDKPHKLKVLHAPSNRLVKGTDHILKVLHQLQADGLDFEIVLVENKSNQEALAMYKEADLLIDDIMQGPYGIFCLEGMAMGKPVMCHIDESLVSHYPGLPIVNVNPRNLYDQVKKVLENLDFRQELAQKGRAYMEEHHDALKSAQQFVDLYKTL